MKSLISRALITAGAAGSALLLAAGVASAHVTVDAPGAAQGGYGVLTFRVPTESESASTVKLTVQLPGLKSARTEPMAGWKAEVVKDPASALATSVTWTADPGVGIAPGQFGQFRLSAGPLPSEDEVSFPAEQTYTDGQVVNWNQQPGPDGAEPESPAPSLTLPAAGAEGDGHSTGGAEAMSATATPASESTTAESTTAESTAAASSTKDSTARWLGGAGVVLGALGLGLGLGAFVRSRKA